MASIMPKLLPTLCAARAAVMADTASTSPVLLGELNKRDCFLRCTEAAFTDATWASIGLDEMVLASTISLDAKVVLVKLCPAATPTDSILSQTWLKDLPMSCLSRVKFLAAVLTTLGAVFIALNPTGWDAISASTPKLPVEPAMVLLVTPHK